jgi:hypothetical protein
MRMVSASRRDDACAIAASVVREDHGLAVEVGDGDESAEVVVCESHGNFLALYKSVCVCGFEIGRLGALGAA